MAPASLEEVLLTHQAVADAAVIGIPDSYAGQLPKAYVVLKPGVKVTEQDIQTYVAGNSSTCQPQTKIQAHGYMQFVCYLTLSLQCLFTKFQDLSGIVYNASHCC